MLKVRDTIRENSMFRFSVFRVPTFPMVGGCVYWAVWNGRGSDRVHVRLVGLSITSVATSAARLRCFPIVCVKGNRRRTNKRLYNCEDSPRGAIYNAGLHASMS